MCEEMNRILTLDFGGSQSRA
uniref:Uncharacterized protein n=1 Tax=Rhizophora mucronata TaxID=61149 RepID=A0A2P2P6I1_RHIMU